MSLTKRTIGAINQMMAVDGTTAVLDAIHNLAFTKTGGVGNAWPGDSSNFRTLLGAQAPIIAQACDNLIADESASFEGNTVGDWREPLNCALAASTVQAWHGTHSLRMTTAAAGAGRTVLDVTGTASTAYTASCRFKGNIGSNYSFHAADTGGLNVGGVGVIGDGTWQTCTFTFTWSAGVTGKYIYLYDNTGGINAVTYWDAIQLEAGAVATPFALDSRTACSMTIPTATIGLTAGQPLTMMFVVNTPWAGDDGVYHTLFNDEKIFIYKGNGNVLGLLVHDTVHNWKVVFGAVNATNMPANTTHIVVATIAADGTLSLTLNNVALTSTAGVGTGIHGAPGQNISIGTLLDNTSPLNGSILSAIWGRVLTGAEMTALSSPATWASVIDLPQITVTGLAAGNAVRLCDAAGNIHASAVEAGGTATLTYTLD